MNKFLKNVEETFKEKINIVSNKIKENKMKKQPKKIKHLIVLGAMIMVAVISTYINIKSYIKTTTENYKSYKLENALSNAKDMEESSGINNDISIPTANTDTTVENNVINYITAESSITSTVSAVNNDTQKTIWPVHGKIVREYIVDSVVYYPVVGIWKIHPGVDISAEAGTDVISVMPGNVTRVYSTDIYGYTIEIASLDYVIRYSGLAKDNIVNEGEGVKAGQKIRLYIC